VVWAAIVCSSDQYHQHHRLISRWLYLHTSVVVIHVLNCLLCTCLSLGRGMYSCEHLSLAFVWWGESNITCCCKYRCRLCRGSKHEEQLLGKPLHIHSNTLGRSCYTQTVQLERILQSKPKMSCLLKEMNLILKSAAGFRPIHWC